jgi:hypothetical protein
VRCLLGFSTRKLKVFRSRLEFAGEAAGGDRNGIVDRTSRVRDSERNTAPPGTGLT